MKTEILKMKTEILKEIENLKYKIKGLEYILKEKSHSAKIAPVDTLVKVWESNTSPIARYFKEFKDGKYYCYCDGRTSKIIEEVTEWSYCKIADNDWKVYDGSGQPVPDWMQVEYKLLVDYPDVNSYPVSAGHLNWGFDTDNPDKSAIYAYRIIEQDIPDSY